MTRAAAFLCALIFSIQLVTAEEITLKNGNKIVGEITGVVADKFEVKTPYGNMQVPRTDIVSIEFPENRSKDTPKDAPAVDESLNGNSYVNRTAGFQLSVPSGWVLAPDMRSKDVVAALKSHDEEQITMVTIEGFAHPLPVYVGLVENQLKARFNDFQEISQTETSLSGKKATRLVMRGVIKENNVPIKCLIYIFPEDENMVRLTFLTAEPLFEESTLVFEKIASSYQGRSATGKSAEAVH